MTIFINISNPVMGQNNDTICLPKQYVLSTIKELEIKDYLVTKDSITQTNITYYQKEIHQKDSIIYNQRLNELLYLSDFESLQNVIDQKDLLIKDKNRIIKNQKLKTNLIIGGFSITLTGAIVGLVLLNIL